MVNSKARLAVSEQGVLQLVVSAAPVVSSRLVGLVLICHRLQVVSFSISRAAGMPVSIEVFKAVVVLPANPVTFLCLSLIVGVKSASNRAQDQCDSALMISHSWKN